MQTLYHELAEVQEEIFWREEVLKRERKRLKTAIKAQTLVPVALNVKKAYDMKAVAESSIKNSEEGLRLLRTKLERGREIEAFIESLPEC